MNLPIQVFNPQQDYTVLHRRLPHWSQAGTIAFITWRTWDSIPADVLRNWLAERDTWLRRHGIDSTASDWRSRLSSLNHKDREEFQLSFSDRWNDQLDACHGECVLRQTELSEMVAKSLLHFHGARYELTDFVVMPDHVHILGAFHDESSMLHQCESWKHFTATELNKALQRKGRFWQQDGFDHLVRSVEQFGYLRDYIKDNPRRAKLRDGEFVYWTRSM